MQQLSYDVIVIGSGATGFLAALKAAQDGASVLMLEKGEQFGGTSAKSGGGIWIPNNPNIASAGVEDSPEKAFQYMRSIIPTEQVDDDTIRNYISNAPRMLSFLENHTDITFTPVEGYADYYPAIEGWLPGGRTMDPSPIDGRQLGDMLYKLIEAPPASRAMGIFSMSILEGMQILAAVPGWQKIMAGIIFRYLTDIPGRLKGKRDRRLAQGNGLIGAMYLATQKLGVDFHLNSPVDDLIQEDGAIKGVVARLEGKTTRITANQGVIIAAGGFDHNEEMRQQYLPQPSKARWSAGATTNTGDLITIAQRYGAALGMMHECWWAPVVKTPDGVTVLFSEKSKPGMIIVDKDGKRFMNEAITYNSYGECFHGAKERGHDCFPAYVVFNAEYRAKYMFGGMPQSTMSPDFMNPGMVGKNGVLTKGKTLDELAAKLGIDATGLQQTADRVSEFARTGIDEDFGRGSDDHDRMYGDESVTPNPCLGEMNKGPFYGAEIFPGDIGTKGGLAINHHGQVLSETGAPIPGLYAAGNSSASVMGNKYPGAGCTLGPAMTIAFLAAEHIHNKAKQNDTASAA
jgi:3-oxosteroid 1-dehydrogenase